MRRHQIVKLLAIFMFVVAPVLYLAVGYSLSFDESTPANPADDIVFYVLVALAAVQPFVIPVLQRSQLNRLKLQQKSARQVAAVYQISFILKAAFIEAIYLYGLVVYIVGQGGIERMQLFYLIGILWTLVYWPTEKRLRSFLEKVGRYDG